MANNAANTEVKVVTPVVPTEPEKLEEVKVTVIPDKEIAAILTKETDNLIQLAFSMQEEYDNASQYCRDSLEAASLMFLKTQCQRHIATWDNLVTKFSKTRKYRNVGREKVEQSLRDNPKTRSFYETAIKAVAIKAKLR